MNRTVKIILKIFLILICAFTAFEVCGAIVNIMYANSQTEKVLEIAENNGGDIWDSYSDIFYVGGLPDKRLFSGTLAIVYSENIDEISSEMETEFYLCGIYPLELVGGTDVDVPSDDEYMVGGTDVYVPSYDGYWDKIDFETNHDKENYYVIDVFGNPPFKHNIINYIIYKIMFKS